MDKHAMAGLSLVELMIAMLVGSLLILATTQLLIDSKDSYLFQQGKAENQATGRFTLLLLDQQLLKSGFRRSPEQSQADAFPASGTGTSGECSFAAGQVVQSVNASTLCIRYQPRAPEEVDCLGNTLLANLTGITKPYTASPGLFVERFQVTSKGQLECKSQGSTGVLLEGIDAIRFEFGIVASGAKSVSGYTSNPSASQYIGSIRYAALIYAPTGHTQPNTGSPAYSQWYGASNGSPQNGVLYQIVNSTVSLRNLMP